MKAVKLMLALGLFVGFVGCTDDERQVVVPEEVADEFVGADTVTPGDELEMEEEAEGDPTLGAGSSGRGH